jgi:hypothetical protein
MSRKPIDIIDNPVLRKCLRSRLRLAHALSWGTVIGTITAFVFLIIYFVLTQQEMATSAEAARASILPILIIQAVILMGLGTNAVATGIAIERATGRIDYHRMTPLSPTAKIFGFLFGLPIRQYFLFFITMPFLLAAVIIGEFSWSKLALYYLVFFTSTWTYHMTGMAAGMLSKRPWQASLLSVGAVFVLYFVLPLLSQIGVTFFEFLTIRPTLLGMVYQEIEEMRPGMEVAAQQIVAGLDAFRPVPFFSWNLHPIVYTLVVQGALLALMFSMVHRKWRDQANHSLTKIQGLLAYMGVLVFLGASIWPIVTRRDVYDELWPSLQRNSEEGNIVLIVLFVISLVICGLIGFALQTTITPSKHAMAAGVRRMRKLGRTRTGFNTDAASSFPVSLGIAILTLFGGWIFLRSAEQGGYVIVGLPPLETMLAPLVLFAAITLFVQGLLERFSTRVAYVVLFLLWAPPMFAGSIVSGAFELHTQGMYMMLPCPPFSIAISMINFFEQADLGSAVFEPDDEAVQPAQMTLAATVAYTLAAAAIQAERLRWSRRVRAAA